MDLVLDTKDEFADSCESVPTFGLTTLTLIAEMVRNLGKRLLLEVAARRQIPRTSPSRSRSNIQFGYTSAVIPSTAIEWSSVTVALTADLPIE
jgi:hypothetical protein